MEKIAIHQFHSGSAYGDAVTNSMLLIRRLLLKFGFDSKIYVERIAPELKKELLSYFTIKSYRISGFSGNNRYEPFIKGKPHYEKGEIATLWVRAVKN